MAGARSGAHYRPRYGLFGLAIILAGMIVSGNPADARRHFAHHRSGYKHVAHRAARAQDSAHVESYSPPSASIIIDGNTGSVLQALNPDALRHPASLTKIMTLYLLFERLEEGRIKLDTQLKVSEHAAECGEVVI